ncbi:hypothetical protein [Pseudomonas fragariae (ex Marin et al. 2024)]|uniref:hypothetical protein n=1 Tax=Pseudomonas fragariae (ex Marin et al. 2024) TaxID=3080056 RepID=UPI003F79F2E2
MRQHNALPMQDELDSLTLSTGEDVSIASGKLLAGWRWTWACGDRQRCAQRQGGAAGAE